MQGQHGTTAVVAYHSVSEDLPKLRIIYRLGIAEVVLGSLSIILGIAILFLGVSLVEGTWCGFFIVLAGGFGIAAGKPTSTNCKRLCHMIFAIIGSLFAAVLFSFNTLFTFAVLTGFDTVLHIVLDLIALAALVLQITSASYCCCIRGSCAQCCRNTPSSQIEVHQQTQPSATFQPGIASAITYQQQQPMLATQQPQMYPYQQQQQVLGQNEKAGGIPDVTNPPSYS